MGFVTKSKKIAEKTGSIGGSSMDFFKVNPKGSELLILPPVELSNGELSEVLFTTIKHEYFKTVSGKRILAKHASSPSFNDEKDELTDLGWKIKDFYKNSDSKRENEFWSNLVPNKKDHIVVLDLNDIDAGPQIYGMSSAVSKVVKKELSKAGDDISSLTDFDDGRILLIETNGEKGKKIRYTAEFLDETANLLVDKVINDKDIDKWVNSFPNMQKLQPKFDEQEFQDYVDFMYDKADAEGVNLDIDEATEDDEDYSEPRSKRNTEDNSRSSRRSKRSSDDDDEGDDEPRSRSSRRSTKSIDEEEDSFDESDLDIEENNNEEETDSDEPKRRSSSRRSSSRKSSKRRR